MIFGKKAGIADDGGSIATVVPIARESMPYFFILPIYCALLAVLLGTAIIARFVSRIRPVSYYLFCSAIGTLIGFVARKI
jgi:hypothetical protein